MLVPTRPLAIAQCEEVQSFPPLNQTSGIASLRAPSASVTCSLSYRSSEYCAVHGIHVEETIDTAPVLCERFPFYGHILTFVLCVPSGSVRDFTFPEYPCILAWINADLPPPSALETSSTSFPEHQTSNFLVGVCSTPNRDSSARRLVLRQDSACSARRKGQPECVTNAPSTDDGISRGGAGSLTCALSASR